MKEKKKIQTTTLSNPLLKNNDSIIKNQHQVPVEFRFETNAFINFLEILDQYSSENSPIGTIIDEIESLLPVNNVLMEEILSRKD